tara:strand:- start:746 stop:1015 length:270 start_codon:yes stop_codon:yes gene_type:complete
MAVHDEATEGEPPLPGVILTGQRLYPSGLEKFVTVCAVGASLLLAIPTLSGFFGVPSWMEYPLACCGFPALGFAVARILVIPIHQVSTE